MRDYASLYIALLSDLGLADTPDGLVTSDMDCRAAARNSLANSFYKKLCPTGVTQDADRHALEKFLAINGSIPSEPMEFDASNEVESCFWDYFRHHLNVCLGPHESLRAFDLEYIREHMGPGPGAAQKADSSSMVTKLFDGELSYQNEDLIPLYRAAIVETGFWADAERRRFEKYGFTRVRGDKIFFAPKNAEISRVCGTQASLDMLFQQALRCYMEERLEWYFGISLSTQPEFNRELARKGSLDGSIGTIDLTSASDYITVRLCQASLERGVVKSSILGYRSRSAVLPDGSEVELKMVAMMGNGFCFPLQTIIFASVIRACYQLMGLPSHCPRTEFGAFGDDLCVHSRAYEFVVKMLTKLGFKVNVGKSFNTGRFRESCGCDYVDGRNIRGVYIRSLELPQQVYSAINRLNRWSARHGQALPQCQKILRSWAREILVPLSESDDAGIHVPFVLTKPQVNDRYWFKYRCHVRRLKRVTVKEPDDEGDPPFNESGIAVGFLAGNYRRRDFVFENPEDSAWKHDWSASYTVRDKMGARARYKIVRRETPFWDWVPDTMMASDLDKEDERRIPLTRDSHVSWVAHMVATY